jgi:hypothetical protein
VAFPLILACGSPSHAQVDSTSRAIAKKLAREPVVLDHVYVNGVLVEDTPEARLSQSDSTDRAKVFQYLDQIFIHGVPYDAAQELGPQAVPILEALLDGESHHEWRSTIVVTIAFLAEHRAFPILRSFTWDRFRGEVDLSTFQALTSAQSVLGASQAPQAVEYLVRGADPASWQGIRWTFGRYRGSVLYLLLSKLAINGLGLTGSARAAEVLANLKRHPFASEQVSNIDEAITRNEGVRRMGLAEYLRHREAEGYKR